VTTVKLRRWSVAFLGGAAIPPDDPTYQHASRLARQLAQMGLTIYNGGGPGVMRASTEGAKAVGGTVVGVTCYPTIPYLNWEGRDPDNHFDDEVKTLDYFDRTKQLLLRTDIHIIFRGGTGTISEFGMTWAASYLRGGREQPIILFGAFWQSIIQRFSQVMYMRPGEFRVYRIVQSVDEAIEEVKRILASGANER
jgi:uncharacterized protein (TIGR00725 family)